MKNYSRIPSFFAGAVMSLVICMSITTALAVSGNVSFNQIQVDWDGETIIPKGEDMTLSSGAKVPASILYTDTNGGGTTYLPVRTLSEVTGTPLLWYGEEKLVSMHTNCLAELMRLPLNGCGANGASVTYNKSMKEVLPIASSVASNLLSPVHHQAQTAFETELPLDEAKGNYVSVTVVNYGEYPVEFQLGMDDGDYGKAYTSSVIPASSTVTRTMQLLEGAKENVKSLYVFVGYPECPFQECNNYTVDVTVEAAQFAK